MGKRSTFPRIERDCYDTPPEAVAPLLKHLGAPSSYWEPCAGAGCLVDHIGCGSDGAHTCHLMTDIEPRSPFVEKIDAFQLWPDLVGIDYIITNPPWTRPILHRMIEHFSDMRPTWLLFDADWLHTKQAAPFMWRLKKIVSVGRVKWIPDSPHTGKENAAWYLFDAKNTEPARFYGRQA